MLKFWSGITINELKEDYVFVFGSNPEGRHGAGAAKHALKFGAVYGKGRGLYGQTYALVTKNLKKGFVEKLPDGSTIVYDKYGERSVTKDMLLSNIREFYECVVFNRHLKFFVCYKADSRNLNGYSSLEMWEMFTNTEVPENVYFHNSFRKYISHDS